MKAKIFVGLGALVLAVVAVAAIGAVSSLTLTRPAPEVKFSGLAGESFNTSDLRGKVVLVNFWGTYCTPCIKEMPKVVDAHRKFGPRGYETVAVSTRHDNPQRVARFVSEQSLPFRIALDSQGVVAKEFGNVRITPTVFLLGKDGRILRRYVGEPNWTEIHETVERALAS